MNEIIQNYKNEDSQEIQLTNFIIKDKIHQEGPNQLQQFIQNNNSSFYNQQPHDIFEQQQQPIDITAYQNNRGSNIKMLNTFNDGCNKGQNKKFGLLITSIWALQLVVNYIFVYMVITYKIGFDKEMFIIYIILYIGILPTSVLIKVPQILIIEIILFAAHFLSSCYYQVGVIILYYQIFLEKQLDKVFIFDVCKLCVIVAAFLYLLILKKKPNALGIFLYNLFLLKVVSIVSLIIYTLVLNYVSEIANVEYQFMPIIFCCFQSYMLVFPLLKIFNGKSQVKTDRIFQGFVQFKLYFYLPCI